PVQILRVPLEIDDRIADQLPRPMERDVAAALHLEVLHAARREHARARDEMLRLRRAPHRDHRRMLHEQEDVPSDLPRHPPARRGALQLQRLAVRQRAEVDREELRHQVWITRPIESRHASLTASASVGCAWIASSISSTVNSFSRATATSWISSVACAPMMC